MVAEVLSSLVGGQNRDGGWGAQPGLPSTTEGTALALWALAAYRDREPRLEEPLRQALGWLHARQRPDGSWPMSDQVPQSNWMGILAVLALAQLGSERARALRGGAWLLESSSEQGGSLLARLYFRLFPEHQLVDLDLSLRGWSWAAGTLGWVEPTSYALVALKLLQPQLPRQRTTARIREAELLLRDRMCLEGGWNYGNKVVLGVPVPPYPDTTALALIALHDRPGDEGIRASLGALDAMLESNRSGLVLALSALCLQLYGRDVSGLRAQLSERFRETRFDGTTRTLALALLALDERVRHFEVPSHA
jgi:hypothetical protein